jgi:hypothetical protein
MAIAVCRRTGSSKTCSIAVLGTAGLGRAAAGRVALGRAALGRAALVAAAVALLAGCAQATPDDARTREREDRLTPGLHSMMVELAMRHASVWFAGDAQNWELADYMVHELEEVAELIADVHPEYDGVAVATLMAQLTLPVIEEVEAAVDARDHGAFVAAYDRLTTSCNACHTAASRAFIVIQRPTAPPLTNLRYTP